MSTYFYIHGVFSISFVQTSLPMSSACWQSILPDCRSILIANINYLFVNASMVDESRGVMSIKKAIGGEIDYLIKYAN